MATLPDAEEAQRRAADRTASVWVAASAGTGKTTVLTKRVLNLLLGGAAPHRLLCLTFTKAAAAEMANRVNARLSRWAVASDSTLRDEIGELTGQLPEAAEYDAARRLFARVLDTPGGLPIMTIHAFCQSVLRRFPLEAGLGANVEVIDEATAAELMREAVAAHLQGTEPELTAALGIVATRLDEDRFAELLSEITGERSRFDAYLEAAGGIEPYVARLWRQLGFDAPSDERVLIRDACEDAAFAAAELRRAAETLLRSATITDRRLGQALADWLGAPTAARALGWQAYCDGFFTEKGEARKTPYTKKLGEANPWLAEAIAAELQRLTELRIRCAAARLAERTAALTRLAARILETYALLKRRRALVDYTDLILATRALLSRPGVAPWVLFKLDGGIDHILVDEAQDTNPDQWEIVRLLAEEFFSGMGARETVRTVFAVGDAKQSIFGFQGADPNKFVEMRGHFETRVQAAQLPFVTVPLDLSFRSTPPVLRLVDQVFQPAHVAAGVALDGAPVQHRAARTGMAGRVELWPLEVPAEAEPDEGWAPAGRHHSDDKASTRLAEKIALRIAQWLRGGERLAARDRAVQAGDILILVRRRDRLVSELIRALKACGVPVAGADRMRLSAQIAVQDLLALGRFLVLPDDELNLAGLLKSPLYGFDDARLLVLAEGRGNLNLWSRLQDAADAGSDPLAEAACRELRALAARADFAPAHELYAEVLSARGGRKRLLGRLGPEAADPIDEFLAQALEYEANHVPSLQGFLNWLAESETEIKRNPESEARDEVRIMTVHGAKGLQAPIVILPDTVATPKDLPSVLWDEARSLMLWVAKDNKAVPIAAALRSAAEAARDEEYRRLLYVALTRAEDRLYICGWRGKSDASPACWYNLIDTAIQELGHGPPAPGEPDPDAGLPALPIAWFEDPQTAPPKPDRAVADARSETAALPAWIAAPPPREPAPPRPLVASAARLGEPAIRSPLSGPTDRRRFQRGLAVHRLLQTLPELPPERVEAAARRYLAQPGLGLEPTLQAEILEETLRVLHHPDWRPLFQPGSLAEVPVVGLVGTRVLSGRIDRLVVTDRAVLIVDYKTNRPPPATRAEVPAVYLEQMAAYRAALARIYPDRPVRALLLWTDTMSIVEV